MSRFRISIDIDVPPAVVFDFVADTGNAPLWYEAVVSATRTSPGPIGPGTTHRLVRSLPGGQVENDVEITDYEPDRRITLTSRRGPTPFTYRYTLEPGRGSTRLDLSGDIRPEGLPGAVLLGPFATLAFKRGMQHNLAALRGILETKGR
ncbi:MAG: SRPBCC family protein [Acidimicrobiia bacterium]